MQFHPLAQHPMQATMPAPAAASQQLLPTATFGAPSPVYHPAAPWTHGYAPAAPMQQQLQFQHPPLQQPPPQQPHFQQAFRQLPVAQPVPPTPCAPFFTPTTTASDLQQTCPPFYATTQAPTNPNVTQQSTHNVIPQPQPQYPTPPTPPHYPFDTTTFPMPAPTVPTTPFAAPPPPLLQSAPAPAQHGAQPPSVYPGTVNQQANHPPVTHSPNPAKVTGPAPTAPTTSFAAPPPPPLQSAPVPAQHGAQPPSVYPGTANRQANNPPVTHSPNPTNITGPAAPYNYTTPSHPTPASHPTPDSSQLTTTTTTQTIPTPSPTQNPTPTAHKQHQSPSRRSRTPLSRHRRTNRSKQRRSSAQGRTNRSTRRHSAPRRRRPRRNHSRSRSTPSRSFSRSVHTRRRRDSRRRTPSPSSSRSPSPRTSRSHTPRIGLQPANILRQQFQRVALTMRSMGSTSAGPRHTPPPPPPPKTSKTPPQQHSHRHSDNPSHGNSSQQPFNVFTSPLPPCIEVRPAAEVPQDQRPRLHSYDIQDAERWIEKVRDICGDSAVDGYTRDQLVDLSQMLHAAGYVPNDQGIEAIRWMEIDSLYPTLIISLHDPDLFEGNSVPFRAPPPFGVTASEWQTNPPAVSYYTFVHGTSFQAGAEILREGILRPTALPRGSRATSSVVYGAATPGDISAYTAQTATAQLLKRPKGRN